ncbi:hypothetical protein O9X98_06160 [Agrobacterium salinitolerans]|nr:hypothetical protein [Agrobacterium salinitolerans]
MRHQGLEVSSIRKLVSEREKIDAVDGLTKVLIANFDKLIGDKFERGRRLSFEQLRAVFRQADDVFRQKTASVACSFDQFPGTPARPKSFAAEALYMGIKRMSQPPPGFRDVYQLFAFRLLGSAKCVRLGIDYLPYAFQYHTAERLMERVRDTDAAFLDVARALAAWSLFIKRVQYTAINQIGGFMSVPAIDDRGALLGEYVNQQPESGIEIEYNNEGAMEFRRRIPAAKCQIYIVSTFVDRFVLRPNQLYAMNLLTDWKLRYAEDYAHATAAWVWPGASGNPIVACLDKETETALVPILTDADFIRAMNPDKTVNCLQPRDWQLPLGAWAHDAPRRATPSPAIHQNPSPFEGLIRRRSLVRA